MSERGQVEGTVWAKCWKRPFGVGRTCVDAGGVRGRGGRAWMRGEVVGPADRALPQPDFPAALLAWMLGAQCPQQDRLVPPGFPDAPHCCSLQLRHRPWTCVSPAPGGLATWPEGLPGGLGAPEQKEP